VKVIVQSNARIEVAFFMNMLNWLVPKLHILIV
jgi:hypothetical protein